MSSNTPSKRSLVRAAYVLLPSALLIGSGCSTLIGLGDYKVDAGSGGASTGTSGSAGTAGTNSSGTTNGGTSSGGKAGQAGIGGKSGASGDAGAPDTGGVGGEAGSESGGAGGAGPLCPNNCDDGVGCTMDFCDLNGCHHMPTLVSCRASTDPCLVPTCDLVQGCVMRDISTNVELLTNGNFDATTNAPWVVSSEVGATQMIVPASAVGAGFAAQTAPNLAQMGHLINEYSLLYQPVTIPLGTVSLTVSSYYQIATQDTTTLNDNAWIDLYSDPALDNTSYMSVFQRVFHNEEAAVGWQVYTELSAVGSFIAGQRYYFALHSGQSTTLPTDFMFDTVSLKAKVCQ